MALTTLAAVLAAMPGQTLDVMKNVSGTSSQFSSMWLTAGTPGAGATPTATLTGEIPTSATTGALTFVNPASGGTNLVRSIVFGDNPSLRGVILIYDRLWQTSGIAPATTTAQTVNSIALTRPDALGANVEAWWQVYALMGAGTPTVSLTYTNQSGTASQVASSGALTTTMAAGRTGIFQLASGDTGVRSIQTWNQNGTTMTSGTIGLVLRRLLAVVPIYTPPGAQNPLAFADVLANGMSAVPNSACLELLYLTSVTLAFNAAVQLQIAQG